MSLEPAMALLGCSFFFIILVLVFFFQLEHFQCSYLWVSWCVSNLKKASTVTYTYSINMHKCWLELCATASSTRLISVWYLSVYSPITKQCKMLHWSRPIKDIIDPHDSLEATTGGPLIRFHQPKFPGKEIIKATTWGSRYNDLPPLVALIFHGNYIYISTPYIFTMHFFFKNQKSIFEQFGGFERTMSSRISAGVLILITNQWFRSLFRCRVELLNFSMGFDIMAPYMEMLHINGSFHH